MTPAELKQTGDLVELGLQLARLRGELEAVTAERDYLRSLLATNVKATIQFECFHDFDISQTAPICRKCGTLYQPMRPSVIS